MQLLRSLTRDQTRDHPAVEAWSLNRWAAREVIPPNLHSVFPFLNFCFAFFSVTCYTFHAISKLLYCKIPNK